MVAIFQKQFAQIWQHPRSQVLIGTEKCKLFYQGTIFYFDEFIKKFCGYISYAIDQNWCLMCGLEGKKK